ncbi:hypothetical protein MI149_30140 (plasmid) [Mycolicibacterium crocinum]|uniref:Uncharacterized protein n=1 Tax=Mycolicibacterium crocinum TaxID=388459 RepID=A0ABY3TUY5_9MYCO|nr:hypothetical protein [Mycolicibacterium crocinum]ULN44756.1 hypothetical protein MI149_30140 [Mycolicibacterium crocinum]
MSCASSSPLGSGSWSAAARMASHSAVPQAHSSLVAHSSLAALSRAHPSTVAASTIQRVRSSDKRK